MKSKTKLHREYLILLVIALVILLQLVNQKNLGEPTSAVILNLKEANDDYLVENPGNTTVNVTIYEKSGITGAAILQPRELMVIEKKDFEARGEQA